MITLIILIFVVGYLAIALEHPIHINKAASAMLTGVLCWTLCAVSYDELLPLSNVPSWFSESLEGHSPTESEQKTEDVKPSDAAVNASDTLGSKVNHQVDQESASEEPLNRTYLLDGLLGHHLFEIASILFFLMGAMTIVELVDANEGFAIVTEKVSARKKSTLFWIVGWITFFLSSVLDNLTTTIVMISLLRKLVHDSKTRMLFVGIVIIAANAGGAWSVIGDVTTTMLWVKHKVTTINIMKELFIPSVICLLVPLIVISRRLTGDLEPAEKADDVHRSKGLSKGHQWLFLILGVGGLLFVPIFKSVTHLPPFMGIILVLSVLWIVSEMLSHKIDESVRSSTGVLHVLRNIDMSSILFFLGILLAVSALGSIGLLGKLAVWLNEVIPAKWIVATIIGLLSAIVDNVPLVAAGIEMYGGLAASDPVAYGEDGYFWMMLAYCAGTGGSCLIIGSAAGVAAMGLEKIEFVWYLRKIGPLALMGYLSGVAVYLLQYKIFSLFN